MPFSLLFWRFSSPQNIHSYWTSTSLHSTCFINYFFFVLALECWVIVLEAYVHTCIRGTYHLQCVWYYGYLFGLHGPLVWVKFCRSVLTMTSWLVTVMWGNSKLLNLQRLIHCIKVLLQPIACLESKWYRLRTINLWLITSWGFFYTF